MYAGDVWLKRAVAVQIAQSLQYFVLASCREAYMHHERCEARFAMLPKLHTVDEISFEMMRQARVSEWVFNPIVETCSADEDFVGQHFVPKTHQESRTAGSAGAWSS